MSGAGGRPHDDGVGGDGGEGHLPDNAVVVAPVIAAALVLKQQGLALAYDRPVDGTISACGDQVGGCVATCDPFGRAA